MNQKVLCIISALMILFTLTACSQTDDAADIDPEAYTALQEAQKKARDIQDAEIKMTADSQVEDSASSTQMNITIKEVVKEEGGTEAVMSITQKAAGKKDTGKIYKKGETVYINSGDEKMKIKASDQTDPYSRMISMAQNVLLDIKEDSIGSITQKKNGTDSIFLITIKDVAAADYIKSAIGTGGKDSDSKDSDNEDSDTQDSNIKKMTIQLVTDKDHMAKSIDLSCVYNSTPESESMDTKYELSIEFKSINTGLTIDFPNFSNYKSIQTNDKEK